MTHADPILVAIAAYRDGVQAFNQTPDEESHLWNFLWKGPHTVLAEWEQPCRTRAGAVAALRLAVDEDAAGPGRILAPMMRAALAYLEASEGGEA